MKATNFSSRSSPLRVLRVNKILTTAARSIIAFFTRRARRREGREGWVRTALTLPILALALIAAGLPRADDAAIRAAIRTIYAPYNAPSDAEASMDRPVFANATKKLIETWKERANNEGEITDLSGGDWFCQCQDWDPEKFRVTAIKLQPLPKGKVRADVTFILAGSESRKLRLIMIRERGKWLIDDLISVSGYPSLTAGLHRELADAAESK